MDFVIKLSCSQLDCCINWPDEIHINAHHFCIVFNSRLDLLRAEKELKMLPRRIILVRHAQSEGNADPAVYASVPDSKLKITEFGKTQAYVHHVNAVHVECSSPAFFFFMCRLPVCNCMMWSEMKQSLSMCHRS